MLITILGIKQTTNLRAVLWVNIILLHSRMWKKYEFVAREKYVDHMMFLTISPLLLNPLMVFLIANAVVNVLLKLKFPYTV